MHNFEQISKPMRAVLALVVAMTLLGSAPATSMSATGVGASHEICLVVDLPEHRMLGIRNHPSAVGPLVSVNLNEGEYEVLLRSMDQRHPYDPSQTAEQWYLEGLDASEMVIFSTQPSSDIPDNQTMNETVVGVHQITEDVTYLRARHPSVTETANSVIPVSVTFRSDACDSVEMTIGSPRLPETPQPNDFMEQVGVPLRSLPGPAPQLVNALASALDLGEERSVINLCSSEPVLGSGEASQGPLVGRRLVEVLRDTCSEVEEAGSIHSWCEEGFDRVVDPDNSLAQATLGALAGALVVGCATADLETYNETGSPVQAPSTGDAVQDSQIAMLHPAIRRHVAEIVIDFNRLNGPDRTMRITPRSGGFRSFEDQDELYGRGGVTNAKGGESYHNYGLAFDVEVFVLSGTDYEYDQARSSIESYSLVEKIARVRGFGWGASFDDPGHFQWSCGLATSDLFDRVNSGEVDSLGYVELSECSTLDAVIADRN